MKSIVYHRWLLILVIFSSCFFETYCRGGRGGGGGGRGGGYSSSSSSRGGSSSKSSNYGGSSSKSSNYGGSRSSYSAKGSSDSSQNSKNGGSSNYGGSSISSSEASKSIYGSSSNSGAHKSFNSGSSNLGYSTFNTYKRISSSGSYNHPSYNGWRYGDRDYADDYSYTTSNYDRLLFRVTPPTPFPTFSASSFIYYQTPPDYSTWIPRGDQMDYRYNNQRTQPVIGGIPIRDDQFHATKMPTSLYTTKINSDEKEMEELRKDILKQSNNQYNSNNHLRQPMIDSPQINGININDYSKENTLKADDRSSPSTRNGYRICSLRHLKTNGDIKWSCTLSKDHQKKCKPTCDEPKKFISEPAYEYTCTQNVGWLPNQVPQCV